MGEYESADAVRAASGTPSSKPATIYDVARLAGVSHQTVSRHLRGFPGIRPETRERVARALQVLDYRPNMTARTLATSRSHRVGALTQEIGQVGPSKIVEGASAGAREAGYLLDIVTLDVEDPEAVQEALVLIMQQDIAGLLAFTSTDVMTRAFDDASIRVPTLIEAEDDDAIGGHPATRNFVGLRLVVDHLVSLGHRRFFHIAGPLGWVSARNRELSYERALAAHGITSLGTAHGDWSAESGFRAAERLPAHLGATALVVANDQMALGAMLALERRGLHVPGDVSVTGFDDIPEAGYYRPPLTTVRLDFDLQGRAAFRRLLRLIEGPSVQPAPLATAEFILRESTGPARG
ncbi:LacI family DNA-binding transcriptional regulator [Micromonospora sp. DT81.3]|uniref:LacI family DNA-binding transcriptional regulator n=1 Tax=Actinomycetes TaxID=1760 RepID=UPI003CF7883D